MNPSFYFSLCSFVNSSFFKTHILFLQVNPFLQSFSYSHFSLLSNSSVELGRIHFTFIPNNFIPLHLWINNSSFLQVSPNSLRVSVGFLFTKQAFSFSKGLVTILINHLIVKSFYHHFHI